MSSSTIRQSTTGRRQSVQMRPEDWERIKSRAHQLYVEENKPSLATLETLIEERLLQPGPSDRQIKTRFRDWGWRKKITIFDYKAMEFIVDHFQARKQQICFYLELCGRKETSVFTASRVKKAAARKNSEDKRTISSIKIFAEAVRFLGTETQFSMTKDKVPKELRCSVSQLIGNDLWNTTDLVDIQDQDETDDDASTSGSDPTVSPSTQVQLTKALQRTANHSPRNKLQSYQSNSPSKDRRRETVYAQRETEPDSVNHLVNDNFSISQARYSSITSRPRHHRRQYDMIPYPNALAYDMALTLLPENDTARLQTIVGQAINQNENAFDFGFSTYINSGHDKLWHDKLVNKVLEDQWPVIDPTGTKRILVECSTYYLMQCLARFDELDSPDDADRTEVRRKLTYLLNKDNSNVLLFIYTVGTLLSSHEKQKLVLAFYVDCWICINQSNSRTSLLIRPVILFILQTMRNDRHAEMLLDMLRSFPGLVRDFDRAYVGFNAQHELQIRASKLEQTGDSNTKEYLIIVRYLAWSMQIDSQNFKSSEVLLNVLEKAERLLGARHVITFGYHNQMANNYANDGNFYLQESYLNQVSLALTGCTRLWIPLKLRAITQLAQFHYEHDNMRKARDLARVAYFERLEFFGAMRNTTNLAVDFYITILRKTGCHQEADEIYNNSRAQRTQAFAQFHNQHGWYPTDQML